MFKIIIRVALAFAVVWMLVPHGADIGAARPGFAAVAHYFGWSRPSTDGDGRRPLASDNRPSAGVASAVQDCATTAAPKRHGLKGSAARPPCPDREERRSVAVPD